MQRTPDRRDDSTLFIALQKLYPIDLYRRPASLPDTGLAVFFCPDRYPDLYKTFTNSLEGETQRRWRANRKSRPPGPGRRRCRQP